MFCICFVYAVYLLHICFVFVLYIFCTCTCTCICFVFVFASIRLSLPNCLHETPFYTWPSIRRLILITFYQIIIGSLMLWQGLKNNRWAQNYFWKNYFSYWAITERDNDNTVHNLNFTAGENSTALRWWPPSQRNNVIESWTSGCLNPNNVRLRQESFLDSLGLANHALWCAHCDADKTFLFKIRKGGQLDIFLAYHRVWPPENANHWIGIKQILWCQQIGARNTQQKGE